MSLIVINKDLERREIYWSVCPLYKGGWWYIEGYSSESHAQYWDSVTTCVMPIMTFYLFSNH